MQRGTCALRFRSTAPHPFFLKLLYCRLEGKQPKSTGNRFLTRRTKVELTGKVTLVTGGTMGLGAAIARELAGRGADVAIAARNLGDAADEVKRASTALGRPGLLSQAAFTRQADW